MPWRPRSSRAALPPNWPAIRTAVLTRDNHRCTIQGPRCLVHANHVDHTDDAHGPNDHRLNVLRAACQPCHMARTARQAHAARPSRQRQPEQHPTHATAQNNTKPTTRSHTTG